MFSREKTIDKIKALMAKTIDAGCTEAEAMAALGMARAMMDAYEVTEEDLALSKEEAAILHCVAGLDDPHDVKASLTQSVALFCDCKGWRGPSGFVFCGARSDAEFAGWLLEKLAQFVLAELTAHMLGCLFVGTKRRLIARGFVEGCLVGVAVKMAALRVQSRKGASDNSRALTVIKTAAIDDAMKEAGIELQEGRRGNNHPRDEDSFRAGADAGDRATFGRPVSGAAGMLRIGRG
jgi:hypothetical protein